MEGQSSTAVPLNMDEMACSIRSQLNSLYHRRPCYHKVPLIYRVPKEIRHIDPVAYEPIFVSIGPYHNSAPNVVAMEREKWKCLKLVLNRNHHKELQDYILAIMGVEEQVRICYQDGFNIESSNFIKMLLLDACFLLHSLYATNEVMEQPLEVYVQRSNNDDTGLHKRVGIMEIQSEKSAIMMSLKSKILADKIQKKILADQTKQEANGGQCHNIHTDATDDVGHGQPHDNINHTGLWYTNYIVRDMLLLENQIPFFVLNAVYEILAYQKTVRTPLAETFAKYVEAIMQSCSYPRAIDQSNRPKDFQHLLHLCHFYFRPSQNIALRQEHLVQSPYFRRLLGKFGRYFKHSNQREDVSSLLNCQRVQFQNGNNMKCWRRAVQYHEAGVQFKKREHSKHSPHSLLDVVFGEGLLEIPVLTVDDITCILLRNFIAFEQACPKFGKDVTAYVAFMSQLIRTPDDVTLLSRRGIVVHHMRSDADVSNFFAKLGKNIDFDMSYSYYLQPLCQQLEGHYQNRLNRWIAWLWQNHFSNPWLSLAVVAAAVVLICTIMQTLFSFLAYAKPAS